MIFFEMKKLLFFFYLVFTSCTSFKDITIDSCEYRYRYEENSHHSEVYLLHKKSCKYCAQRRKEALQTLKKQL